VPIIPVGEWLPDQPPLNNPGTVICSNCFPRTNLSYGPLAAAADISTCPLTGSDFVIGAFGAFDALAFHPWIFVGTSLGFIYVYDPTMNSWATGFTPANNVNGPYDFFMPFAQFGQDVFSNNLNSYNGTPLGSVYTTFNGNTSPTFAATGGGSPAGAYLAVIKNFLWTANTWDPIGGYGPQRSWWSAYNNPGSYPTPGSATAQADQSDYNDTPGGQGEISGITSGLANADGGLFFYRAIYRIIYAGPPAVFAILPADPARGCIAPGSLVTVGQISYFLSAEGFMMFDGATVTPIGAQKVDAWFFANVKLTSYGIPINMTAAVDVLNRNIVWTFTNLASAQVSLIYNYITTRFAPAPGYTQVWTFTGVDPNDVQTANCFNATGTLQSFTGANLAAVVGTTESQPTKGRQTFITSSRALVDGGSPTVQLYTRNVLTASQTAAAASTPDVNGQCAQRVEARYIAAAVSIAASGTWSHIQGVEIPDEAIQPGGWR